MAKKKPKPAPQPPPARSDGLVNLITGLGTSRDKRMATSWCPTAISIEAARQIYRGNGMAARIVELKPKEMLRAGFEVKVQADEEGDADIAREASEEMQARLEELCVNDVYVKALAYQRAYGGAAIFPVVNDGRPLHTPLSEERATEVKALYVFEPSELQPVQRYGDLLSGKFGQVELWRLQPITQFGVTPMGEMYIHESRLIVFQGIRVSRAETGYALDGWGDSIFTRLLEALNDFAASHAGAATLVHGFGQKIFKLKGLAQLMSTAGGEQRLRERMVEMDLMMSWLRAVLIDAEEDFEQQQTPVSGLPELLDRAANLVAAIEGIPVTILMGQAPAGLNATGAADIESFNKTIAADREALLRKPLERLIRLLFLSKAGPTGGREPENWSLCFKPLSQPTEKEQAETRAIQADTDCKYVDRGILQPMDVTKSRFGGDAYSLETKVDFDALAAYEEAQRRAEEEAARAQAAAPQNPQDTPAKGAEEKPDGSEEA